VVLRLLVFTVFLFSSAEEKAYEIVLLCVYPFEILKQLTHIDEIWREYYTIGDNKIRAL
jgi:hypothetical protein